MLIAAALSFGLVLGCPASKTPTTADRIAAAKAKGKAPQKGPDEVPVKCNILHDGLCYEDAKDACAAAGCFEGDSCSIMESYPGKVACTPSKK